MLFNKSKTILIQCPPSKSGSYTIPSSVTTIGLDAFAKCSLLTSINISTSVQSINNGAFIYCYGLISLSIPSSVTFIQSYALSCGNGLTSIYLTRSFPVDLSTSDGVFFNVNKNSCTLYVPYGSKSAYQSANQWKDFTNIVETPGFKLSASSAPIGASQGSILNIHISSDVTWTASSNQTWLSVNPSSGTGLEKVFTSTAQANPSILSRTAIVTISATGVESQTLTITQDGSNALLNVTAGGLASALTSAELAGVTKLTLTGTIDARDFKTLRDEMPLLAELDLSGVTVVAYIGTLGTSSTSNMFYPANTVPDYAFVKSATWEGKASLTSVILPSSITSIGYVAFAYCSGLTGTFTIPFSVSSIGAYAFYVCQGLTSIVIPSTVTSIGTRAFSSCSGLTSLYSNTLLSLIHI